MKNAMTWRTLSIPALQERTDHVSTGLYSNAQRVVEPPRRFSHRQRQSGLTAGLAAFHMENSQGHRTLGAPPPSVTLAEPAQTPSPPKSSGVFHMENATTWRTLRMSTLQERTDHVLAGMHSNALEVVKP